MRLPALLPTWLRQYQKAWLGADFSAGLIVTVMLIPQSLAYALLAGLPPQYGMYASILPLLAYAWLGTSMVLAVGPVAVLSLMTANAIAPLASAGSPEYIALSITLAALSGLMLLAFGALRLGALAQLLSHPVIAGFISGSAIFIATGQLKPLLGLSFASESWAATLWGVFQRLGAINPATAAIGLTAIALLVAAKKIPNKTLGRTAPLFVVALATAVCAYWNLPQSHGVKVVGALPSGLPGLHIPVFNLHILRELWLPALLISLVGMVESISVAQSLAQKRKQRIAPNREFLALGASNLASAFSGGFPVTGGFARSVVNFSAGAMTPLAGVFSAFFMALVLWALTGWFYFLPLTVLAATIIVAVLGLVDWSVLRTSWAFDKADGITFLATLLGVLALGVEEGVLLGVALSLASMVYKTSHPHIAVVGRVAGSEHFRNVERFEVQTLPHLLALRIDENLYFGNASVVEEHIQEQLSAYPKTQHLLIICSAINRIDSTALDMLLALCENLQERGITLFLSDIKGPVRDSLQRTALVRHPNFKSSAFAHEIFEQMAQSDAAALQTSQLLVPKTTK